MELPLNPFKRALAERRLQIGLWSQLCSPIAAEVLAGAGLDWVVIDTEHAPNELPAVADQLRALYGGSASPVVRVAWNDMVPVKRLLDIGAQSLLFPFVQSAEEARQAVAYTRYPPLGVRGVAGTHRANRYGRVKGYHARAHQEICVLVQVESLQAVDRITDIAAVEGIDGLFIGPADLAASLGHLGDIGHAQVQEAIAAACKRCAEAGKPIGILAAVEADARRFIDMGFGFVAVGSDLGLLATHSAAIAARFKPGS